MKNYLIVSFFLFIGYVSSTAQVDKGLTGVDVLKEKSQEIMDDFKKDEISLAFLKLRAIWILPSDELDYLEKKTIEQINMIGYRFGAPIGTMLVKEQQIDGLLYRLTYVVKYEHHALRFLFTYYNGKDDKWFLNSFKFDDTLTALID